MHPASRISSVTFALALAAICAEGIATSRAEAASGVPFLPHQAVYDLSLQKSRGNATINNAKGRILYNFTGSACEGYTTDFRQVSQLDTGETQALRKPVFDPLVAIVRIRLPKCNRIAGH